MNPRDLVKSAEDLASSAGGKPRQSNLLRATSTAYYALFHALARCCADMMIGSAKASRSNSAWRQVYRSLEHSEAKRACQHGKITKFPQPIQDFANCFVTMQEKRHKADYDPVYRVNKSEVLLDIAQVANELNHLEQASVRDRRAFVALVLFKSRHN